MAKESSPFKVPRHHSLWHGKNKLRCSKAGCKKRAKDFNPPLCRIHSPRRSGYIKIK
jgi:hypothetical protein